MKQDCYIASMTTEQLLLNKERLKILLNDSRPYVARQAQWYMARLAEQILLRDPTTARKDAHNE